jgi:F-type H+-transporting ATPase subunit b
MILASNSLTSPAVGTIFWAVLIFGIFFYILTKFAWKPILSALKQREDLIKGSLEAAENARREMIQLQSDNEAILQKAREEREDILKEARDVRDKLIGEAKVKATQEASKIVENAKTSIERERNRVLSEIHDQLATLSVDIASKLLGEQLCKSGEQEKLIKKYLDDIKINRN